MDPFRLCLALGPVAIYLLWLGAINLRGRPLLLSGVCDTAILALAVAGLMVVGPMELFFPYDAAVQYGPRVWLLLATLYVTCSLLLLLLLKPRLVIYNISVEQDPTRSRGSGGTPRFPGAMGGRQLGTARAGGAVVR